MGYVGPGRTHPMESALLWGGWTHLSAAFGGTSELWQSSRAAVTQLVYKCSFWKMWPTNCTQLQILFLIFFYPKMSVHTTFAPQNISIQTRTKTPFSLTDKRPKRRGRGSFCKISASVWTGGPSLSLLSVCRFTSLEMFVLQFHSLLFPFCLVCLPATCQHLRLDKHSSTSCSLCSRIALTWQLICYLPLGLSLADTLHCPRSNVRWQTIIVTSVTC